MNDLLAKIVGEVIFRAFVWIIEIVATSRFAQDVVHNLFERKDHRGPITAAWSALCAIPSAFEDRTAALPTFYIAENLFDVGAAIVFAALFTGLYHVGPTLLSSLQNSTQHLPFGLNQIIPVAVLAVLAIFSIFGARVFSMYVSDKMEESNRWVVIAMLISETYLCVQLGIFLAIALTLTGWPVLAAAMSYLFPMLIAIPVLALFVRLVDGSVYRKSPSRNRLTTSADGSGADRIGHDEKNRRQPS